LNEDFGVSITVKAHDVFFHTADWIERWQIALRPLSEQSGEHLHSKVDNFFENTVVSPNSPDFGPSLCKRTGAWNAQAAIDFE